MLKVDKYYYSDAKYQLEINLHKVRKELITMLEFYEQTDCEHCLLLKCKCVKTDTVVNDDQLKKNEENTINNEPSADAVKDRSSPSAATIPKPKWEKTESPAPSTPEKVTLAQDIETWMDAAKPHEDYTEKLVTNSKHSLVTIESVRPADIPFKTLQRSNVIVNSSNVLNSPTLNDLNGSYIWNRLNNLNYSNTISGLQLGNNTRVGSNMNNHTLEAFFKYFKQINDTKIVYSSSALAAAFNKQNYSYF